MATPGEQASPAVVAITGAASGIGAATARLAAARGHAVALLDHDGPAVDRLGGTLADEGAAALAVACDVADERQVDGAFGTVAERLGPVGGLVVSAGIDRSCPLPEQSAEAWDQVIAVNLRGAFLSCRAAVRQMVEAGVGGSIVCVSSPFALIAPAGGTGAYSASKGGVSALVRALAVDHGPQGIRVNAILPGPTDTPLMWANVPDDEVDEVRATVAREVPLGRLAMADEPARAALWLLSDEATYVTGAQIAVDGGVLAKASVSV